MNKADFTPPASADLDETAVSRAELHIEREKIEIERERLALERERLSAERERWKTDAELKLRAEGRGISASTLVFIGIICVLAGVIFGVFANHSFPARPSGARLSALVPSSSTNTSGQSGNSVVLRPVETGNGKGTYLLIIE